MSNYKMTISNAVVNLDKAQKQYDANRTRENLVALTDAYQQLNNAQFRARIAEAASR